eukprot:TRINITY_DN9595_c0_g1_i1.p1 TRINITY_DN9595_c0_g1~~TRINITY_DN9595_c0_g1_i1.p1  ORF type:complete len:474 (+),score=80.16 TRINITY_DN9595_c0_g1_i1:151-1572(+)
MLQLYPGYVTVSDFAATPRPVHKRQWIRDGDVSQCVSCGDEFTFVVRKHHCRICGNIYCAACSSQNLALWTDDGVSHEVRACDSCHADYQQPIVKTHAEKVMGLTPMRSSTLHILSEREIAAIARFLSPQPLLAALGSACRHLYFRTRDNLIWQTAPQFAAPHPPSQLAASYPGARGVSPQPASVSPVHPSGGVPRVSTASDVSSGYSCNSPHSAPGASPLHTDPVVPGSPRGRLHPMRAYHTWRLQLEARRQKLFRVQRRRLTDILTHPLKVGIVGPKGVGKTALVNHFEFGTPYPCGAGAETVGARVRQIKFDVRSLGQCHKRYEALGSVTPSLQLVDCSGDPATSALLPHYLCGVQVAVICVAEMKDVAAQVAMIAPMCSADVTILACLLVQEHEPSRCRSIPAGIDDPRVTVCTEADPFSGRGVGDVFRMCAQLYIDQHVIHAHDVMHRRHDRRTQPVPLDLLLALTKP